MTDKPTRSEQRAEQRRKNDMGLVFIKGFWCRKEDAPKIRRLIEKARPEVERIRDVPDTPTS